jgi:hypothetical protein
MPVHKPKAKQASAMVPAYCAGGHTGRQTLTRERVRQIEAIAMSKFQRELVTRGIRCGDLLS